MKRKYNSSYVSCVVCSRELGVHSVKELRTCIYKALLKAAEITHRILDIECEMKKRGKRNVCISQTNWMVKEEE